MDFKQFLFSQRKIIFFKNVMNDCCADWKIVLRYEASCSKTKKNEFAYDSI